MDHHDAGGRADGRGRLLAGQDIPLGRCAVDQPLPRPARAARPRLHHAAPTAC
ncbi:MAG: hypothetical protein MZW92_06090 [Comamonadaceae bacterium]|nr:hypothetical protein [Comamonadaceae bacterium]